MEGYVTHHVLCVHDKACISIVYMCTCSLVSRSRHVSRFVMVSSSRHVVALTLLLSLITLTHALDPVNDPGLEHTSYEAYDPQMPLWIQPIFRYATQAHSTARAGEHNMTAHGMTWHHISLSHHSTVDYSTSPSHHACAANRHVTFAACIV